MDVLIKFSENIISVELNIDIILNRFLLDLIQIGQELKNSDNFSKIILICSNIFKIILYDNKLYSINNPDDGKTKEIQKLINDLIPSFEMILDNNVFAGDILSILCLII